MCPLPGADAAAIQAWPEADRGTEAAVGRSEGACGLHALRGSGRNGAHAMPRLYGGQSGSPSSGSCPLAGGWSVRGVRSPATAGRAALQGLPGAWKKAQNRESGGGLLSLRPVRDAWAEVLRGLSSCGEGVSAPSAGLKSLYVVRIALHVVPWGVTRLDRPARADL